MDLYQAFVKGKRKRFETYYIENAYDATNIKVNNALMEDIPTAMVNDIPYSLIEEKSLEVSNFFEDLDEQLKSLDWWK